ncbi:MAG: hypothetical protein IKY23_08200 [Lachnospiraceae bacterium]|nr:hypothetical protein [Lachnospiraceae bacterium]
MKNLMRRVSIVAVLISLLMVSLTGCSSTTTVEETKVSETVEPKEEVVEVEVAEAEAEPDPTAEPTPEPTPIVYEGIDMESQLPGVEWILTFKDIILEPKIVVFSDETGKKQIIEKGDVVYFNPDVDLLAVYLPEGAIFPIDRARALPGRKWVDESVDYVIFELEPVKTRELGNTTDAAIYVEFNGEEYELPFELVLEE